MLNLIRIDRYRLLKGKMFYICLGIFMIVAALTQLLMYAVYNPAAVESLERMGITFTAGESINFTSTATLLEVYHYSGVSGGMFALVVGCVASTVIGADFEHGFIKNIAAVHENKWRYVCGKIVSLSCVNFIYITISLLLTLVLNGLMKTFFPVPPVKDFLFYGCSVWFLLNGFSALIIMIYIITRSYGVAIASSILLGSGAIVSLAAMILGLFDASSLMNYTLYMNMSSCPYKYTDLSSLRALIVGIVCCVIYTMISKFVLAKRDI